MSSKQEDLEKKGPKKADYEVVEGAEFTEGFDPEGIKKSAELDIHPPLNLKELVDVGKTIRVTFDGEPRKVKSSKLPRGEAWFINAYYNGVLHSMVLPNSLRHSLSVMKVKNNWTEFNGKQIEVISQYGDIDTPTFSGKAKTYRAVMPEDV